MRIFLVASTLLAMTACGADGTCGPVECAGVCASAAAGSVTGASGTAPPAPAASGGATTSFEKQLVDPLLTSVRAGVQPWSENSIGICKGEGRDCEEFLGTSVTDLPP